MCQALQLKVSKIEKCTLLLWSTGVDDHCIHRVNRVYKLLEIFTVHDIAVDKHVEKLCIAVPCGNSYSLTVATRQYALTVICND